MIKRQKTTSKSPIIRVLITIIPVGATVPGRPQRTDCDIRWNQMQYRNSGGRPGTIAPTKPFCFRRNRISITTINHNIAIPARATGDGRPYGYYRWKLPFGAHSGTIVWTLIYMI